MFASAATSSRAPARGRHRLLRLLGLVALLLMPAPARAADPKPIDWNKLTAEATDLLSKYIQINTTNPPGNEIAAAKLLKDKFLADGIPAAVLQSQPGRAIVAARMHGVGKHNKSLILLSHMDVVPADPKDWQVPPFSGQVKGGEIWGRGALDDKGPGVVELMAMLAIKRSGVLLNRDVLFLATADEEEGGRLGAGWLVEHQPDVLSDAGYLLNEGGEIRVEPNEHKFYAVSVTEKTPLWIRLTATGAGGHASTPPEHTAVTRLIRALDRLNDYRPPIKVVSAVRNYFRIQAELKLKPPPYHDLLAALRDPAFKRKFLAVPAQSAMVRNTITPTVLSASQKTNVIPFSAYAEVDCRLLPGESSKAFLRKIRQVVADGSIQIEELLNFPSVSSPASSALMSAIEALARRQDQAPVVPTMLDGFTDCHYFRRRGVTAYGFMPLELNRELDHTVHGANERIAIKNLRGGIVRMVELLKIMGGRLGR